VTVTKKQLERQKQFLVFIMGGMMTATVLFLLLFGERLTRSCL
jgi:hypothetical protein